MHLGKSLNIPYQNTNQSKSYPQTPKYLTLSPLSRPINSASPKSLTFSSHSRSPLSPNTQFSSPIYDKIVPISSSFIIYF
jgi:hypothetical protein